MKKIELVVSLVRHQHEKKIHWLARRTPGKPNIEFIVSQRLENESPRETVAREVAWTWELQRKTDFLVASMAQLNLEFIDEIPGAIGKHQVAVSFFNVEIYRRQVIEQLDHNSHCIWLGSDEICNHRTKSGSPIDPLFVALNQRGQVIQHWESNPT